MSTIVTIAGSPSGSSTSDALVSHVTRRMLRAGQHVTPVALRKLPRAALLAGDVTDVDIAEAVAAVQQADAIVIVSPAGDPALSGSLNAFLELLPPVALRGKPVLPLVTGEPAGEVPAQYLGQLPKSLNTAHIGPGRSVPSAHIRVFADGGVLIDPASAVPVADLTAAFLAGLGRPVPAPPIRPLATRRVSSEAGAPDLTVRQVQVGDYELEPLLDDLKVEYGTRYGRSSAHTELTEVPTSDFMPPEGAFLVLIENDEIIAGGAIRRFDRETAEVKRVWTAPQHRRRGLGSRLMAELERRGLELGYRRIHLTTGPRQPEATALYLAAGYQPRFDVGADPESIGPLAFGKELVPGAGTVDRARPTWAQAPDTGHQPAGVTR